MSLIDNTHSEEPKNKRTKSEIEPIPQTAQICAWCCEYLMSYQETTEYAGPDKQYKNWVVHLDCEKIFSPSISSEVNN